IVIFNQFDEFGNHLWHYEVTGNTMREILENEMDENDTYFGVVLSSGSSGTMGCGDFLKEIYPSSKIAVSEALQCPTILLNGYGGHRIEGIGDKHIPWIHNVRNTDMAIAIDDEHTIRLLRLFNEPIGREYLKSRGVPAEIVDNLDLLGISSIGNLLSAIKFAKYYELDENDVVLTVFTDSMELYLSRTRELTEERGEYTKTDAIRDFELLEQLSIDYMMELDYYQRKRIHNLKYYTWIEQQGKELAELDAQWYDYKNYWKRIHDLVPQFDRLIEKFNSRVGLL
ncbi:pyridoxal-5-phosphate-dependent protein subunit beta, partial [bacterium]